MEYREYDHYGVSKLVCAPWGVSDSTTHLDGGERQSVEGYRGKRVYVDPNRKILASHPVEMVRLDAVTAPCYMDWASIQVSGSLPWIVGPGQGGRNVSLSLAIGETPDAFVDQAVVALWAEVNSSSWEGGVAVAELADVVSMVVNPFKALQKVCLDWKKSLSRARKAAKSARAYLDSLANSWLQWRYAIVPLISDVETVKTLYNETLDKSQFIARKGNSNNSVSVSSFFGRAFSGRITVVVDESITSRTITSGKMLYTVVTDTYRSTLHRWGFDPSNLIPAMWELVPFSFVGDWFVNTGDWLSAMNPRPDMSVLDSCLSIKREKIYTWDIREIGANPGGYFVTPNTPWAGGGQAYMRYTRLSRVPLPAIPSTPSFNPSFYKWKRALDSASLAWNLIPKNFLMRK